MNTHTLLLICVLTCGITACETTRQHTSTLKVTSSHEHYLAGSQLYEQWLQATSANDELLIDAEKHLATALELQPDNVLYQVTHYNIYVTAHSSSNTFNEDDVLKKFLNIHPELRGELITPAYIPFTHSIAEQHSTDTQLKHIQRSIEQNPKNPQNWLFTAQLLREKGHTWLAASSAARAHQLAPNVPNYAYELGVNLSLIAASEHCSKNEYNLLKESAKYLSDAARFQADNAHYFAYSSNAYLKIGLPPLAVVQAKKAYEIEQNEYSLRALFNALFFNKQFNEAWDILDELTEKFGTDYSFLTLKNWYRMGYSLSNKSYEEFKTNSARSLVQSQNPFYILMYRYFYLLNDNPHPGLDSFELSFNQQDRSIYQFIEEGAFPSQDAFLDNSVNHCDRERRKFYVDFYSNIEGSEEWLDLLTYKPPKYVNRLNPEDYWRVLFQAVPSLGYYTIN